MSDTVSKSWFCVFNNPADHGYSGSPEEVLSRLKDEWISDHPTRTGAWTYCISSTGMHHVHMVLEDSKAMRFSAVKNTYAVGMHFEPTKGSKDDAEDYINKRGKYAQGEEGENILCVERYGEIKGYQGQKRDLEVIEELILLGKTPFEILDYSFSFRRYEKMIKDSFFSKRYKETPLFRDVKVYWHVGPSGSGKSYCYIDLESKSSGSVYFVSDYSVGFMDNYCAQPILFLDEFRRQISYSLFLSFLDGYRHSVHSRYSNVYSLWTEVHVTSVFPPEKVYELMVSESDRKIDSFEQLRRRINYIIYHWKDDQGDYQKYEMSMSEYRNYDSLVSIAKMSRFMKIGDGMKSPFDE